MIEAVDVPGKILENSEIASGIFRIEIEAPEIAVSALPGQFVTLRISQHSLPFLRRPMSIALANPDNGVIRIYYKVVGIGTLLLSELSPQASLDIAGPFGRPFSFSADYTKVALLGRGMGIAPLIFKALTEAMAGKEVWAFFSARSMSNIFGEQELRKFGVNFYFGSDDASKMSSDYLLQYFFTIAKSEKFDYAATCGSKRMIRLIQDLNKTQDTFAEALVEQKMACGIGFCKGCAITILNNFERKTVLVCRDGPVFPANEVIVDEL